MKVLLLAIGLIILSTSTASFGAEFCVSKINGVSDANTYWLETYCSNGKKIEVDIESNFNLFPFYDDQENVIKATNELSKIMKAMGYYKTDTKLLKNRTIYVKPSALKNKNICLVIKYKSGVSFFGPAKSNFILECDGDLALTNLDSVDVEDDINLYMKKKGYNLKGVITPDPEDTYYQELIFQKR